jgi:hypothetical protein
MKIKLWYEIKCGTGKLNVFPACEALPDKIFFI